MTWNERWRGIVTAGICTAIAFVVGGQGHASAANVLLLSTGFAPEDTAIQSTLQGLGHTVDIGPQFTTFDGSTLSNYDVLLLVPNYNYSAGDMPDAGQNAIIAFVAAGGGLVTGEWTVWKRGTGGFIILYDAVPVTATALYRNVGTVTYTADTPDDVLNSGVDPSFTFLADSIGGAETNFTAKDGATIYYDSDYQDGASGVIGWTYGAGRVISMSTLIGPMELADPNYSQVLANAVTWTVTPH